VHVLGGCIRLVALGLAQLLVLGVLRAALGELAGAIRRGPFLLRRV
jgi:hypothetical protein